jgi:hypothetical protein
VLKKCAEGHDQALCGFYKCSHINEMLRVSKRRTPWLTA